MSVSIRFGWVLYCRTSFGRSRLVRALGRYSSTTLVHGKPLVMWICKKSLGHIVEAPFAMPRSYDLRASWTDLRRMRVAFERSPFSPDIPLKMDFASSNLSFRSARSTAGPSHWSLAPESRAGGDDPGAMEDEEWRGKADQGTSSCPLDPKSLACFTCTHLRATKKVGLVRTVPGSVVQLPLPLPVRTHQGTPLRFAALEMPALC